MACGRYELAGAKQGSYSTPARSYAVNRLTPHYRSADKPFYAMDVAKPYHLMKADRMPYQDSQLTPARTYAGKAIPYTQNRIKQYFEQPAVKYTKPIQIELKPVYDKKTGKEVYARQSTDQQYEQRQNENPTPARQLKPNKRYMKQTPEMIYINNLPQIKPQYVPNTLHHRYGVVAVVNYENSEQKAGAYKQQNRERLELLEGRLAVPVQKPVIEVRKGWDEHNQKVVPIVYIMGESELEAKLMERYKDAPRDFFYTEIHYTQRDVYGQLEGNPAKGIKDDEEIQNQLLQAHFNQMMLRITQNGKKILEKSPCKNCSMPTDGDICENCGMVQA